MRHLAEFDVPLFCSGRAALWGTPMWIGGSSEAAIRRTARFGTGWLAGGETSEEVAAVIPAIRRAAVVNDEDHYGAGFAFWLGQPDDPARQGAMAAFRARTRRDPACGVVTGDVTAILQRIADCV